MALSWPVAGRLRRWGCGPLYSGTRPRHGQVTRAQRRGVAAGRTGCPAACRWCTCRRARREGRAVWRAQPVGGVARLHDVVVTESCRKTASSCLVTGRPYLHGRHDGAFLPGGGQAGRPLPYGHAGQGGGVLPDRVDEYGMCLFDRPCCGKRPPGWPAGRLTAARADGSRVQLRAVRS